MTSTKTRRPPAGLDTAGKRLWRRLVVADLEYSPPEMELIEQACRIADTIVTLRTQRPSESTLRLLLAHQMELRRTLASIDWPDDVADNLGGKRDSAWGRKMASRRWGGQHAQAPE